MGYQLSMTISPLVKKRSLMSRRSFLDACSAAGLMTLVSPAQAASATLIGGMPSAKKMKRIGCTTVCFRSWFSSTRATDEEVPDHQLSLPEVPAFFAEELGVHNIEVWSKHFDDSSLAYCEKLRTAAERVDSKIINVQLDEAKYEIFRSAVGSNKSGAVTGSLNLSQRNKTERQRSVDFIKLWMDRAAACGATSLRANVGRSKGVDFDLDITTDSFRQLAEHGRDIDVRILVENHGPSSSNPDKLVAIVRGVDSEFCRSLPDFGNIPKKADEAFRRKLLESLFPFAYLVSAKGMWFDEQMRHLLYDIGACVRIGEAAGFRGIYSAEYWDPERRPYDPLRVVRRIITLIDENI